MKNMLGRTLGLLVIGALTTVAPGPAQAASAAGPYYATPSWDQTLPAATRFIVLTNMNSEAVLDRETGLVWERSPLHPGSPGETGGNAGIRTWLSAQDHCNRKTVGNRKGWRLPTVQDLASLIDPAVASPGPTLSPGHPFSNVQSSQYWSATAAGFPISASDAWSVLFVNGDVNTDGKSGRLSVWCVRGGQGPDVQ